jgi:23S rRNA (guanosine2251-2'-O)-methyltransferase
LVLTERVAQEIGKTLLARVRSETSVSEAIARLLPTGAVHQGAALLCEPLPRRTIEDVLRIESANRRIILVLDQISDPQNVGAILRSAAAFGVTAVVVQDRHAPPESGVLAKAASGALDLVPYVRTVNIARAIEQLGEAGFWRVALAADGEGPLKDAPGDADVVFVLGSEGSGIRRLVRERCDSSAFVPIRGLIGSLNVSNAAAIALYECRRAELTRPPQVS